MKKFLLCIAAGYLLVFLLFLGLVKHTGRMPLKDAAPSAGPGTLAHAVSPTHAPKKNSEKIRAPKDFQKNPEFEKVKNTGPVETFYKSGRLSSEWVLDEKKKGMFRTYFPDGKPWQEFPFENGLPQGVWKTFLQEGALIMEETFSAGDREGSFVIHYSGGKPLANFVFHHGVLSGAPEFWSEDSKPAQAPALSAPAGTGYFKAYDDQGHEYVHWQQAADGEAESKIAAHYLNGAVSLEWTWNPKTQDGKVVVLNPQGQRRVEYVFHQGGLLEGRLYSEAGSPLTQLQRNPDSLAEEAKGFYPGGEVLWTLQRLLSEKGQPVYALKTFWEDHHAGSKENKR